MFGVAIAAFGGGHFNADQFRHAIERMGAVEYLMGSYYEHWLSMLETLFLMRGLDNVRAEFSLTALVYNLRRAVNILGVDAMMAAVRA